MLNTYSISSLFFGTMREVYFLCIWSSTFCPTGHLRASLGLPLKVQFLLSLFPSQLTASGRLCPVYAESLRLGVFLSAAVPSATMLVIILQTDTIQWCVVTFKQWIGGVAIALFPPSSLLFSEGFFSPSLDQVVKMTPVFIWQSKILFTCERAVTITTSNYCAAPLQNKKSEIPTGCTIFFVVVAKTSTVNALLFFSQNPYASETGGFLLWYLRIAFFRLFFVCTASDGKGFWTFQ